MAYLNAGTNGPVPHRALQAAQASVEQQVEGGRAGMAFFESVIGSAEALRARIARLLGCQPGEVALTGSTTDGVNAALAALDLGPGDEVLTSDEEHPGVLAPLAAGRERRGFSVRVVPFRELPGEVGPATRLVACSHVSWVTGGALAPQALAEIDPPVLLDGAQGLGAVPVDVHALGCDFYAASGQKWLCGPGGVGYLYVRGDLAGELPAPWPGYGSLTDPGRPLELPLHPDARRFDTVLLAPHQTAWALAALDVLEEPGIDSLHGRAAALADRLAALLSDRGATVAPRERTTLVSWEAPDPEGAVERLHSEGIVIRGLPGRGLLRASVGAWSSQEELERLVAG